MNNPFYLLSTQYKREESKPNPKTKKCVECDMEPQYYVSGDFKGWCKCCAISDMWIADWAEACWNEQYKPESLQNRNVFMGSENAIRKK